MTFARVHDGGGYWINSDATLMTKVWTSRGWLDLPDEYEVISQSDGDETDGLSLTIRYEGKLIRVQSIDFEEAA